MQTSFKLEYTPEEAHQAYCLKAVELFARFS